ncbi:DUF2147 domain-containing protein [Jiella sp. M17.18]|uniref:DUF2147 domain-containing protein n=1 Tax=Jiella sp. M17.18 TaxID=3234247 RepID=UPI0034DE4862
MPRRSPARLSPLAAAAAAAFLAASSPALAAAGPLGRWIAEDGTAIAVRNCPAGFCATIVSGPYSGEWVAQVATAGPTHAGTVRDPRNDSTYSGALRLNGKALELRGCLAKVLCRTVQTWRRP